MPLFAAELNALANHIGRADLTMWLHTAAPTDAAPANGRTNRGGGAYEAGVSISASSISDAVSGDIRNNDAINFGVADENVGTVGWWSIVRGNDGVAWGTITQTIINQNDSISIPMSVLQINGATT